MDTMTRKKLLWIPVACAALLMGAVPIVSNAQTWVFGSGDCVGGDPGIGTHTNPNGSDFDACGSGDPNASTSKIYRSTSGGNNITITGWSDTGAAGLVEQQLYSGLPSATNPYYTGVTRYNGSGLGLLNENETGSSSGNHGVDNKTDGTQGNVDALLFDFGTNWALTSVQLGYESGDSDLSVLRWTGAEGAHVIDPAATWAGLVASGSWELVGNYANVYDRPEGRVDFNNEANVPQLVSSAWLVAGYSSIFGSPVSGPACTKFGTKGCYAGNDAFKIWDITGNQVNNTASEPSTLALLSLGLFGGVAAMRRRRTQTPKAQSAARDESQLVA